MKKRTLSLIKGGHKYVFRYSDGSEKSVVDEIMRLAEDTESKLTWLDAAVLSFQVSQYIAARCDEATISASKTKK